MVPPRAPLNPAALASVAMPKIGQLDVAAVVDKHVRRLDVEVEYAVLVREGQRLDEGIGNAGRLIVRE